MQMACLLWLYGYSEVMETKENNRWAYVF